MYAKHISKTHTESRRTYFSCEGVVGLISSAVTLPYRTQPPNQRFHACRPQEKPSAVIRRSATRLIEHLPSSPIMMINNMRFAHAYTSSSPAWYFTASPSNGTYATNNPNKPSMPPRPTQSAIGKSQRRLMAPTISVTGKCRPARREAY